VVVVCRAHARAARISSSPTCVHHNTCACMHACMHAHTTNSPSAHGCCGARCTTPQHRTLTCVAGPCPSCGAETGCCWGRSPRATGTYMAASDNTRQAVCVCVGGGGAHPLTQTHTTCLVSEAQPQHTAASCQQACMRMRTHCAPSRMHACMHACMHHGSEAPCTHVGRRRSTRATPTVFAARFRHRSLTCSQPAREQHNRVWQAAKHAMRETSLLLALACGVCLHTWALGQCSSHTRCTHPRLCLDGGCRHEHLAWWGRCTALLLPRLLAAVWLRVALEECLLPLLLCRDAWCEGRRGGGRQLLLLL
jgi:hypothetical protein